MDDESMPMDDSCCMTIYIPLLAHAQDIHDHRFPPCCVPIHNPPTRDASMTMNHFSFSMVLDQCVRQTMIVGLGLILNETYWDPILLLELGTIFKGRV